MKCSECERIRDRKGKVVYSDPIAHIVLPEKPAAEGHAKIYTREHAESLDELSHDEVEHLFEAASRTATMMFELLGAEGTNIILNEGSVSGGHLHFDVVARSGDDDLDTGWEPKQLSDAEMEDVKESIKDRADLLGHEQETKTPSEAPTEEKNKESMDKEDPRMKHLNRLP